MSSGSQRHELQVTRFTHDPRKIPRHPLPRRQEINLECGSLLPLFRLLPYFNFESHAKSSAWEIRTFNFELSTVNCLPMPGTPEKQSWLNRTVLGVGLTSLFSDWSHETATAVLPAFLAAIGAGPVWLGAIEGIADGLSSFT